MTPLDAAAQALVDAQGAYRQVVEAVVTRGDRSETLAVTGGSVTQDVRSVSRWSGSLVVHSDRIPTDPADLLTPFGSEVQLAAGVRDLHGTASVVPLGMMPVTTARGIITGDGAVVTLGLGDRSERVAANRFAAPLRQSATVDLAVVAARIVANRDPRLDPGPASVGVTVGDVTDGEPYFFGGSAATDPWRELRQLLAGGGFRVWFDRVGELIVDEPPTGFGAPREGAGASIDYTSRPPNVVVVRSSASATPATGVWEDSDPSSVTYVDGPYGRVTMFATAPVRTDAGAANAARRIGSTLGGRGGAWQEVRGFDPTWDPDDALIVHASADPTVLAVDAVTVSFDGPTVLMCRTTAAAESAG